MCVMTSSKRRGPETLEPPPLRPRSKSHPPVTSAVLRTPDDERARAHAPPEIELRRIRDETRLPAGMFQATVARAR